MTSENLQLQGRMHEPFAYLYPYEFVLLTSFRKNGLGVPTAMWFAHDQGKLYMVTGKTAGKMKRIRNSGRVLLAPCNASGSTLLGEQIEANACELPPAQHDYANTLLANKYGEEYEMSSPEGYEEHSEGDEETFIEIVPVL